MRQRCRVAYRRCRRSQAHMSHAASSLYTSACNGGPGGQALPGLPAGPSRNLGRPHCTIDPCKNPVAPAYAWPLAPSRRPLSAKYLNASKQFTRRVDRYPSQTPYAELTRHASLQLAANVPAWRTSWEPFLQHATRCATAYGQ